MNTSDYLYGTNDLIGVIAPLRSAQPPRFLLSLFFPGMSEQETETIMFDRIAADLSIAPFVSPLAKATAGSREGYTTDSFKPAYIKMLDLLTPQDLKRRLPGEPLGGSLSAEDRALAHIGNLLAMQRAKTYRRLEVMASQLAISMAVTIVGEKYPSVTVDFGRKAGFAKVLAGAACWDQAGVSQVDDLDIWLEEYAEENGSAATDAVFTADAWRLLSKDPRLEKLLDRTLGQSPVVDLGFTHGVPGAPVYKGSIGQVRFWVYNDSYKDVDGQTKKLLSSYTVLIGSTAVVDGVKAFGMIEDFESLEAIDIFSKTWMEKDPSAVNILSQSAPLLVPKRANGVMRITVKS